MRSFKNICFLYFINILKYLTLIILCFSKSFKRKFMYTIVNKLKFSNTLVFGDILVL
jgi:hypothetical protein